MNIHTVVTTLLLTFMNGLYVYSNTNGISHALDNPGSDGLSGANSPRIDRPPTVVRVERAFDGMARSSDAGYCCGEGHCNCSGDAGHRCSHVCCPSDTRCCNATGTGCCDGHCLNGTCCAAQFHCGSICCTERRPYCISDGICSQHTASVHKAMALVMVTIVVLSIVGVITQVRLCSDSSAAVRPSATTAELQL